MGGRQLTGVFQVDVRSHQAALERVAAEFSEEQIRPARTYLAAALEHETAGETQKMRAFIVLAALSLGGDVWKPKTDSQQLRHDLRTHADQLAGLTYAASKRRRKPKGEDDVHAD
jgi:hypothetical protein